MVAPAAVPANVQHKLRSAVRAAVADAQFVSAMNKVSTPISYLDAPEFKEFWVADAARLRTAVQKIGIHQLTPTLACTLPFGSPAT